VGTEFFIYRKSEVCVEELKLHKSYTVLLLDYFQSIKKKNLLFKLFQHSVTVLHQDRSKVPS